MHDSCLISCVSFKTTSILESKYECDINPNCKTHFNYSKLLAEQSLNRS